MKKYVNCLNCVCLYRNRDTQYECRRHSCAMDIKGYACWPLLYKKHIDSNICGCFDGIDKNEKQVL